MDTQVIDRLRNIAGISANQITAEDKSFIKEQSALYGLVFEPKGACKACYADQAALIYKTIIDQSNAQPNEDDTRKYILKAGVNIIWQGIHINEATATDENCERWIAMGLKTKYFSKLPQPDAD